VRNTYAGEHVDLYELHVQLGWNASSTTVFCEPCLRKVHRAIGGALPEPKGPFVIKVGKRYYKADDVLPVSRSRAAKFQARAQASEEAQHIRNTWDVDPDSVVVSSI